MVSVVHHHKKELEEMMMMVKTTMVSRIEQIEHLQRSPVEQTVKERKQASSQMLKHKM